MITWFSENLWALWLLAAIVLAIIEMLSLDFFCLMLSVAALLTIGSTGLVDSFPLQVVVFAILSILLLLLIRPRLVNKLHKNTPHTVTNSDALIGQDAEVITKITHNTGLIRLAGDTWTARTRDQELNIPIGSFVKVTEISGATAFVEPVSTGFQP